MDWWKFTVEAATVFAALAVIIGFVYWCFNIQVKTPSYRKQKIAKLEAQIEAQSQGYSASLENSLMWSRQALGWFTPSRCLTLAYFYPVLFFLISWVAGGSGKLGEMLIFPEEESFWQRAFIAFMLCGIAYFYYWFFVKNIPERFTKWVVSKIKISGKFKSFIEFFAGVFVGVGAVAVAVAVVVVVVGAVAGVGAGVGAVAVVIAVVIAGVSAVVVAVAIIVVGAGFGGNTIAAAMSANFILVFYMVLPLLNAGFDWVSIRITRLWLKRGRRFNSLFFFITCSLMDLACALLCLVLLAFFIPVFLEIYNAAIGLIDYPPFDWLSFIREARCAPFTAGLTVTGMLVTTFWPSVFHLGHSIADTFLQPARNSEKLHETLMKVGMPEHEDMATRDATLLLIWEKALFVIPTLLVVAVLSSLLYMAFSYGDYYLYYLIGFALWAGSFFEGGFDNLFQVVEALQNYQCP